MFKCSQVHGRGSCQDNGDIVCQLGSELRFLSSIQNQHIWVFTDLQELDLSDLNSLESKISKIAPSLIINCAAYTSVDKAESENELANILN